MTIHVTDAFASALGTDAAFADCWLTAEEINTDPEAAAFVASFVAATAAQLGVDPAAILISGVSTDGDATPGCANGATQQGMTIQVNNGYVASLGNADALADCYLSAEEIASDPEAAALVNEFIIATAAQLGVAPETISISGLSTDGDQEPGCADGFDPPTAGPPAVTATAVTVNVHPDYAAQLGNADALADCFLTAEEIAADPEAAALAASFIATTAAQLGVEPSMINMNSISLDNDQIPGCAPGFGTNKPSTTSGVTLQISQDFADNLGSDVAFADCWLSAEEIASDPDAAAFAAAFIASTAASLGIEPSAITLSGISTDGDMSPGCGSPGVGNSLNLQIGADFASTFGNDEAFADCWLSAQEIANDPEAAQFAAAFIASTADSMGIDPADLSVGGISTAGNARPGCGEDADVTASSISMDVGDDYLNTIVGADDLADCVLDADEIANNQGAQDLVSAFLAAQADAMGIDVDQIEVSSIGTNSVGCGQASTGTSVTMDIDGDFAEALGDDSAFADCWLSAAEMAADPDAAAFAQALITAQASALGIHPGDVELDGLSTVGADGPGCDTGRRRLVARVGRAPVPAGDLTFHLDSRLVPMLGSPAAMADCYLSGPELAKDADAVKLVRAVERLGVAVKGFRLPGKHRPNPYRSPAKHRRFPVKLPKEVCGAYAGFRLPGCGAKPNTSDNMDITVDVAYAEKLGSAHAWFDNVLSEPEIKLDADAMTLAEAFVKAHAVAKGMDPARIRVTSIARGSDPERPTLYPGFAIVAEE
jgi:hypothetical protein